MRHLPGKQDKGCDCKKKTDNLFQNQGFIQENNSQQNSYQGIKGREADHNSYFFSFPAIRILCQTVK